MKFLRDSEGELNVQVVVAVIGAAATLLAALIAGGFGLIQLRANAQQPPDPTVAPAQITALITIEIDGPAEAPLNELTYFTLISEDAVRAEWTIAGFSSDEIDPFRQTDQVFVEPQDASRVGESFTLVVTVYDAEGNDAGARHRFVVVAGE